MCHRDDTEAVLRDVCLETAKTEENVRKYIKVNPKFNTKTIMYCKQ